MDTLIITGWGWKEYAVALTDYDYPGNVRELLNVLERAVVFKSEDFTKLMVEHRQMNCDDKHEI